jgi:hypothetical protein
MLLEVLLDPAGLVVAAAKLGSTPRVTTLVRNRAGVRLMMVRSKMSATWEGRPTSRWSRITPSKNARPEAGRSNTRGVGDLELAHGQLIAVAGLDIGARAGSEDLDRGSEGLVSLATPGPSRSQMRCKPAGSSQAA